ncbi:NAD(P)-dependent oxidoreductase [Agrobacterium vitis]
MRDKAISILKERRSGEKRVILLPDAVREFTSRGYRVFVEHDAGLLAGFPDDQYAAAGAEVVDCDAAWTRCNVIFKYKAPGPDEYRWFRPGMHLASFMHAEGNLQLVEAMRASGMSGYALEFFQSAAGDYPVPVSDNEISGKLAILHAAYHLQSHMGGSGTLLADVPGSARAKVVVIGYGNAGGGAARLAAAMGADVTVFGTRWEGLRRFMAGMPANGRCLINEPSAFEAAILEADVVVGAVLISTYDTPTMLSDELVSRMKPGSVIVDVTCGYGKGYMPSFSQLTTYEAPFYVRYGILHCKIDAMPASVPLTAAQATSANVWRYLLGLAQAACEGQVDITSSNGCVVTEGRVSHPEVLRHIQMHESGLADAV